MQLGQVIFPCLRQMICVHVLDWLFVCLSHFHEVHLWLFKFLAHDQTEGWRLDVLLKMGELDIDCLQYWLIACMFPPSSFASLGILITCNQTEGWKPDWRWAICDLDIDCLYVFLFDIDCLHFFCIWYWIFVCFCVRYWLFVFFCVVNICVCVCVFDKCKESHAVKSDSQKDGS